MILAQAGYNAVLGLTLLIIGIDIVLRLLMVEKAAATIGLIQSEEDRGDQIQQDDLEKNPTRPTVEVQELNVENHPVTVKAGRETKIPAILRLVSSRRLCCFIGLSHHWHHFRRI